VSNAVSNARSLSWRSALWAAAVITATALACWNQIARTLDAPLDLHVAFSGSITGLPRPHGGAAVAQTPTAGSVTVGITHVSPQLQWMVAAAIVLQFLILAAAVLTIQVVWVRTSQGRPFARPVTVSLLGLAILVAVAGSANEVLESLISQREAFEAFGHLSTGAPYSPPGFTFSGLPLIVAAGIGILASAFEIGARLSRDTEGLV